MIALLIMLAQESPPPLSMATGRAFPAERLVCDVTAPDNATFTVAVKEKNGTATLKSSREDLFPSGNFVVAPAAISRIEDGKPVDYRVSIAGERPSGTFSLGMKVEGGVATQAWLRLMPPGPYRSDRFRNIGSARCIAEKKS